MVQDSAAAGILYRVSPPIDNQALNDLFAASWPDHTWRDFEPILSRSLDYIAAYHRGRLVGFVNLAWDGGIHAFLLDTTVHPDVRRRGIGQQLVHEAAKTAQLRGMEWLHVDYEAHLESFYRNCGFVDTNAGLMRLKDT
jgi:GNAT superfamily N-acetyltransferase